MDAFLTGSKNKPEPLKKTVKTKANVPWIEKYRPATIDEVAHQTEVVSVLKKCLEGADLPNLLFYGRPGTGKTSLILALAKQLFGPLYSERVLELNASDERGINVVREKVKAFAHLAVSHANLGKPGALPPYKLIILDEADSMTAPAQAALRRTMETETRTTRFCLTCNYVTRIIDPITSRCAKFRFRPLDNEAAKDRLRYIADAENICVSDEALMSLLNISRGDLRSAITLLQSAARLYLPFASDPINSDRAGDPKYESSINELTRHEFEEVASVIPQKYIDTIVKMAKTMIFEKVQSAIKDILIEGHSAHQALHQLHDHLLAIEDLDEKKKALLLEALAVADVRLIQGADEYLQLLSIGASLIKQFG